MSRSKQAEAIAQLSPVTARAITRPLYRNERIHNVSLWFQDNHKALDAYYQALNAACGEEIGYDFITHYATQYQTTRLALLAAEMLEPTLSQTQSLRAV